MRLQRVKPLNFGPFRGAVTLDIEPDVTVLTGPNDVGKSCLLRLLTMLDESGRLLESDVNSDLLFDARKAWTDLGAAAEFTFTAHDDDTDRSLGLKPGDVATYTLGFRPDGPATVKNRTVEKPRPNFTLPDRPPIKILVLSEFETVAELSLDSTRPQDLRVLSAAFGSPDRVAHLKNSRAVHYPNALAKSAADLNRQLAAFLPPAMDLSLRFVDDARQRLHLNMSDGYGGDVPLDQRGGGVRRITALMMHLAAALPQNDSDSYIVIIDEPETSLHADAQHTLRRTLEQLAARPRIQVVYATHSSAMINGMRPESVRVVGRNSRADAAAASTVSLLGHEFGLVRATLGMSLADSLLLGPVTLVVEGKTEALSLPALLMKLEDAEVAGFDDARVLLGQCAILDGQGDSFERLARVARDMGSKSVIFLDGDKEPRVRQSDFLKTNPDVTLILLPNQTEFEDVVPRADYFEALARVSERPEARLAAYNSWMREANLPERMMFSKKVGYWFDSQFEGELDKTSVMREAVASVDVDKIQSKDALAALLSAIRIHLGTGAPADNQRVETMRRALYPP